MQIYRPGMGKFSSQTISGKSDEGSEFATASGGNSADESRSNSKQPDENTGKKFTNFIINNLGKLSSQSPTNLMNCPQIVPEIVPETVLKLSLKLSLQLSLKLS